MLMQHADGGQRHDVPLDSAVAPDGGDDEDDRQRVHEDALEPAEPAGHPMLPDSLNHRLPAMAVVATSAASGNCTRCSASRKRTLATDGMSRAATISTDAEQATMARIGEDVVQGVVTDIPPFWRTNHAKCAGRMLRRDRPGRRCVVPGRPPRGRAGRCALVPRRPRRARRLRARPLARAQSGSTSTPPRAPRPARHRRPPPVAHAGSFAAAMSALGIGDDTSWSPTTTPAASPPAGWS